MKSAFRAAVLQFPIRMGAVDGNTSRAFALLREAAVRGAALSVLPEMWSTGFSYGNLRALCGTTPDLLRDLCSFAADRRMVIAGSLPERSGAGVYNTLYLVDATGRVAGRYRKTHLFSKTGEHLHFRRGHDCTAVRTAVGKIGPQICYDLRFPEVSRTYYREGAQLCCVSAQWPGVRQVHLDLLAAARAVENQLFVAVANAVGKSGPFRYAGGSVIVSPWGEQLAHAGKAEGLAVATIDPAAVEDARRRIPCAQDRNERAYRKTRNAR